MKIDKYLNLLFEQFDASIAVTDIDGDFKDEWTDCYETRCHRRLENNYERRFCKATCQITAANRAITRLNGITGKCTTAPDPNRCIGVLKRAATRYQKRIDNFRESQDKARAKAAEFRRRATGVI
jgi:hypothetical protein